MTSSTTYFRTPDQYEILSLHEALERFPQFNADVEEYDSPNVIYLKGDYAIDGTWNAALDSYLDGDCFLLIEGNLLHNDNTRFNLWVTGDIYADVLGLDETLQCKGTVHVKNYAYLFADDHEVNRNGPTLTLNTLYVFSWYYSVSGLTLSNDTLVFLLSEWDYSHQSNLPGTVIPWHESFFVLRDDLQELIEEDWHDSFPWKTNSIRNAVKRGESILREGVTLAGIQACKAATDAEKMGDNRLAWLYYQEAARLAPGYYPAVYNMGNIMSKEGAIQQALSYLERAASLYPTVQTHLLNEAAFDAILLACWLEQTDHASELVNRYTPLNRHYKMLRARAEVFLMTGYLEQAKQDLDAVISHESSYGSAMWLRGLVAWKQGKQDEATQWQERAISESDLFTASYETHCCTAFLRQNTICVDWETLNLNDIKPVQDEAWWLALLKSDHTLAHRLPKEMRTHDFLSALLEQQAKDIAHLVSFFPPDSFTPTLAIQLVQENGSCLEHIPHELHSLELYQQAKIHKDSHFPLSCVPKSLLNDAVCQLAVERGASLEDVPQSLRTERICRQAIVTSQYGYQINYVPAELQTEDMWTLTVAYSDNWFIANKTPSRYTTPEYLHKALKLNKALLHELPGNLFDSATYTVAESLYGQDADWAEIVDQHRPQACMGKYSDFAKSCWLVFWTEVNILQSILNSEGYKLYAFQIPDSHFNQNIANACFVTEPIHLASIPTRFISEQMCQYFIKRYPDELKDVPFAMRTVDICETALKEDFKQFDLVPVPVFTEVMARLYKSKYRNKLLAFLQNKFYKRTTFNLATATVALQYGRSLLMAPANTKTAIQVLSPLCSKNWLKQKLDPSLQEHDAEEAQAENLRCQASYLLGYAYLLKGNKSQADLMQQRSGIDNHYELFVPEQGQARADFDQRAFDKIMHEYDHLVEQEGRQALAWETILQARQLLQDSGNTNPTLWAYVLDRQRFISYELQDWENNLAVCEEAVRQLSTVSLWAYLPEHNVIRSALRAALHQLGNAPLEIKDDPTEAEITQAVEYIWKALQLIGPTENLSETWRFYDAQLWNLVWLAERDSKWQATLNQTMKRIEEFDWQEYLYTDKAIELMKAYTQKNQS